jgi:hypothetical protein
MKARCHQPNHSHYSAYGGSGVKVCKRWLRFENFLADMGERPSQNHSIDRYPNPNGDYRPGNCRWATPKQQANNRQVTKVLTYKGRRLPLADLAREHGMTLRMLRGRLQRGYTVEQAVETPRHKHGKRQASSG